MVTHVTYKPHYCDMRYGEYVSDRIFHVKMFGIPRNIPFLSTMLVGRLNSILIPKDITYLCNGIFELYPVYYRKPKSSIVTMMKELTFWNFDKLPNYKRDYIRKMFLSTNGIITDTKAMQRLIHKHIPEIRVEVVNPFCAQPSFDVEPDLSSKNIIFVGSFESPNKGYKELEEAFKKLNDSSWNLYMIGKSGTDFVRPSKGIHVTNYVPDLKVYFSKCSIYVHPANFEPFGITVLEAMSAGLIPVVTRNTGVSEVLERNGLKNLIIPDNKPETINSKIEEISDWSMSKKKTVSSKCRKIIRNSYLEKDGLKDFRKKFRKLIC